jgi:hypothetical protein
MAAFLRNALFVLGPRLREDDARGGRKERSFVTVIYLIGIIPQEYIIISIDTKDTL